MEICANKWYIWNQNPSWISTSSLTVPGSFSTSTQHRIEHYGATAASFITLSGSSSNAVLKDLILEINPGHDGLITLKDFRFQGTHCTPCGCFHCSLLEKYIKCEERESLFFLKLMWCVKKPGLKMNTSQLPTESSRLAVPNISFYIWVRRAWVITSCL